MKLAALILAVALASTACADIVHLNDGTSIEGTVKRTRDGYVVTDPSGKTTMVPADAVKSFELKNAPPSSGNADERLASLRRAVSNLDDLKQIIERYKTFAAQTKGTPAAREAGQDLALWQDRLDKKMTKAGKDWVTPEQLTQLQAASRDATAKAVPLIAAGKLKEGTALVDQALAVTPASGELLYLKGVIQNRLSQLAPSRNGELVPARNAFQAAAAQMPDHGPSHNNIAVILWRTRQQMPAMLEFNKAMVAMPRNQTVLDNVAEALHSLPDDYRKNDLTKKVVQLFNTQDALLQREMAQKGMYRWGSQWLDTQQYTDLETQRKAVQDKLDAMQKEFDANTARLAKIRQDILEDQQMMSLMVQQSTVVDNNGNAVQFPLPQRYYDIQRAEQSLENDGRVTQQQQADLSRRATEEKKHLPVPHYSGIQKSFDIEGMPSSNAAGQAALPATAPGRQGGQVGQGQKQAATRPGGSDY